MHMHTHSAFYYINFLIHSYCPGSPFLHPLLTGPLPAWALALCPVPSLPLHVCVQILSTFQVIPHLSPPGYIPIFHSETMPAPSFLWPGCQGRPSEALSWLYFHPMGQYFDVPFPSLRVSGLPNGRIWSKSDSSLYFVQLPAQCFTQETSPVGVCEMSIICLYYVLF